jgi:ionotropic glutamate receptor
MAWSGGSTTKPRGWVFPNNGQPLRIGVPNKPSFKEFVASGKGPDNVTGYCIDIFNAAVKLLPYPVPSKFISIGDGIHNPKYDDIINMVANNVCSDSLPFFFCHFPFDPMVSIATAL